SSCRVTCTRTTSPHRRTPSSGRVPPRRTRCSVGWSPPRSTATVPASCSTSRMAELRDEAVEAEVVSSDLVYEGLVWDVRSDTVRYGDGEIVRQYVDHPGAAAVVAIDDEERVALIQQY